mmetsp:Transcript_47260/g.126393  ORF Transcript_47260/g.126393 Transcript_47260/m.126393 type:complete len:239 (+) Transcript_47260:159-875(+)
MVPSAMPSCIASRAVEPSGKLMANTSAPEGISGSATSTTPCTSSLQPAVAPFGTSTCTTPNPDEIVTMSPSPMPFGSSTTGASYSSSTFAFAPEVSSGNISGSLGKAAASVFAAASASATAAATAGLGSGSGSGSTGFTAGGAWPSASFNLPCPSTFSPSLVNCAGSLPSTLVRTSPRALTKSRMFLKLVSFPKSNKPALSANKCFTLHPRHVAMTTPCVHAILFTCMAFRVSHFPQV